LGHFTITLLHEFVLLLLYVRITNQRWLPWQTILSDWIPRKNRLLTKFRGFCANYC